MVGMSLSLPGNLPSPPTSGATALPGAASKAPPEAGQSPPTDFEQLLQGLSQTEPATESALPELMAVVASLAGSSNLLDGIEKPVGVTETPKEKKPKTEQGPAQGDP